MYSNGVAVFSLREIDHSVKEPIMCFRSYHHHSLRENPSCEEKPSCEETAVGGNLALQLQLILCLVKEQVN
jgi:hypothetical protein